MKKLDSALIPTTQAAIDEYQRDGGQLSNPSDTDPIVDSTKRTIRDASFHDRFPSIENLCFTV